MLHNSTELLIEKWNCGGGRELIYILLVTNCSCFVSAMQTFSSPLKLIENQYPEQQLATGPIVSS